MFAPPPPIAFLPLNSTTPNVSSSTGAPAFLYKTKSGAEAAEVSELSSIMFSPGPPFLECIIGVPVSDVVPTVS